MTGWTAIVPVKAWDRAKARLALSTGQRRDLARAMSLDVLDAVSHTTGISQIVVVSSQAEARAVAPDYGALALAESRFRSRDPLNDAIARARLWATVRRRDAPVVVIPADLPTLTPAVLSDTLDALAPYAQAFTPDAEGTGTTLYAARNPERAHTRYGPGSARRHVAGGAHRLEQADPRARQDVDTLTDLRAACEAGVGLHTRQVSAQLRPRTPSAPV